MKTRSLLGKAARSGVGMLCALLLAAGTVLPACAEKSIDFSGRGAGYSAVLYDNANGLPTSEANDIVQSDDGFIWIGGYSGLIRYDGNEFYRYSAAGLSSVVCLCYNSRRQLWIGTNDSGVAVLQYNEFEFYNLEQGLPSASIRSITEDDNGNMIIATTKGVAYITPEGDLNVLDDDRLNNDYVCEVFTGEDGAVYGVTLDGDFFTIENLQITRFFTSGQEGLPMINTVYPDPQNPGFVYVGTQESTVLYCDMNNDLQPLRTMKTGTLETVNAIRLFDGILWVAADTGVGLFDGDRRFVQLQDLPMTNSIDHLMEDYEGNLWFTSSRQGIMKIVENRFVDLSAMARLDPMVVNTTCLLNDELYVGTDSGLVVLNADREPVENALTALLTGVRIRGIVRDSAGIMWFCTYSNQGLVRYDPATGDVTNYNEENGLLSSRVRMVQELADGSLAVATNNGVNIITGQTITAAYSAKDGITNTEILSLAQGTDGTLYLGSDGGGIYAINGTLQNRYGIADGLQSEVILRMKKDPVEDLFWIITSNSISYLKNGAITTLSTFPYANNFDLFFDTSDRAWILSSNGIYVVSRNDLLADKVDEFTLFDKDYGLPGIATANSHSCITADGELYVSATTGVYSVNINKEIGGSSDVKLGIPFVSVDDEPVWIQDDDEVRIPADCKRLNIYANAFTYALVNPHLSYQLKGFDDEPTFLTKQDMAYASYTNLHGGDYTFELAIVDDVTGQVIKTVSLRITKQRAFYEHVWFWILAVLLGIALVVAVIVLIYRRKTTALLRKQAETKELVNEMIHVFSGCIDMKDAYTNGHSARVAKYTAMMAERLGKSPEEVEEIYKIALLHDIGKIGIPDQILNKPGRLDDEEFAVMKSHAQRGYEILKEVRIDQNLAQGAGYHHEKYDGSGYPAHLKGEEIPEIARIIAVADAFDAMYSTRPYRKKMPLDAVAAEIQRCNGTQFAPEVVAVFMQLAEEGAFNDDSVK